MAEYNLNNHPLKAENADSGYLAQQRKIEDFYGSQWYQSQMAKKRKAIAVQNALRKAQQLAETDEAIWAEMPSFSENATEEMIAPTMKGVGSLVAGATGTAGAIDFLGGDATLGEIINPNKILENKSRIRRDWSIEDVKKARNYAKVLGYGTAGALGAYGLNKVADKVLGSKENTFNEGTANESFNWLNYLKNGRK